jgi:hypothetical protein
MIHSKNQIIRSMKSYEVGGSTETCGPGRGCKQSKAAAKNKRQKTLRNIKEGAGKVAGAVATVGALAAGAYYGNKLLKEQRNGGSVKRKK